MAEFEEQRLIAKGVSEKQTNIIKEILTLQDLDFENTRILPTPFVNYKFRKRKENNTFIPCHSGTIDLRISYATKEGIKTNKEIQPTYIIAQLSTDFTEYESPKQLLDKVVNKVLPKPFAQGAIRKNSHQGKTIEDLLKEKQEIPLVDESKPKQKYYLPPTEPFIALFFSVYAIGDTTIEIINRLST